MMSVGKWKRRSAFFIYERSLNTKNIADHKNNLYLQCIHPEIKVYKIEIRRGDRKIYYVILHDKRDVERFMRDFMKQETISLNSSEVDIWREFAGIINSYNRDCSDEFIKQDIRKLNQTK